jgi:hypothetical protein
VVFIGGAEVNDAFDEAARLTHQGTSKNSELRDFLRI